MSHHDPHIRYYDAQPRRATDYPTLTDRERRDLIHEARRAKGGQVDRVELYKKGKQLGIRRVDYDR